MIVGSRNWVNRCLWELCLRLCRIAELWDCKIVGLRDCGIAGLWDCGIVGLRDCGIAGLHDFKILESRI